MSVAEKSDEFLTLDPRIKFVGVLKEGNMELSFKESNENFDKDNTKLSCIQTPHIIETGERFSNELGRLEYISFEYDKAKLFDLTTKEKTLTFATTKDTDNDEIVNKVSNHILNPEKDRPGKFDDETNLAMKSNYDNPWQSHMLNCIKLFKEFTMISIHFNEKTIKTALENYNKQ
jgi:hypothetical protein